MKSEKSVVNFLEKIKKNFITIKQNEEKELYKRQKCITKREERIKIFEKKKLFFNKINLSEKKKENQKNHILIKNFSDFDNINVKKFKLSQKNLNDNKNLTEYKKSHSQINVLKYKNIKSKKQLIDIHTKKYDFYTNPLSKKMMSIHKNYDKFLEKYEKIKMKKKKINLEKYQTQLLEIGSLNLPINSIKKLYKTFRNIRKENSIRIEQSDSFIKNIEDDESDIYNEISKNQDDYIKVLDKYKIKLEKDKLPKIRFKRIFKQKNKK